MFDLKRIFRKPAQVVITSCMTFFAALPASAALPAVMDRVPAKVDVIVVVPNIQVLDDSLKKLIAKAGLPIPPMGMVQLLEMQSQIPGLEAAIDMNGSLLFTVSQLRESIEQNREPILTLYIPSKDPKALKKLLFRNDRFPPATKMTKNYLIIGKNDRELAFAIPGRLSKQIEAKLGAQGAAAFKANAISAIVLNTDKSLLPVLRNQLAMIKNMAGGMPPEMQDEMAGLSPMKLIGLYGSLFERILGDNRSILVGAGLNKQGILLQSNVNFKAQSVSGKFLKGGANTTGLLRVLPKENYVFSVAADTTKLDLKPMMKVLVEAFMPEPGYKGISLGKILQDALVPESLASKGALGYYAPISDKGTVHAIGVVSLKDSACAKKVVAAQGKGINALGKITIQGRELYEKLSWTPNAMTVAGHQFSKSVVKQKPSPYMPEEARAIFRVLGLDQQVTLGTRIDNQLLSVVSGTVPSKALLTSALISLKNKRGLSTGEGIVSIRKNLHARPTVEAYISPNGLVKLANPLVSQFAGFRIELPADIEPIGLSYQIENHNISERVFISYDTIQQLVASTMATMRKAQGGAQPASRRKARRDY